MVQPNTLVSLAILHPDPPDDVRQAISGSIRFLDQNIISEKDEQVMREFKAAARKCLEQLSEATLAALVGVSRSVFAGNLEMAQVQRRAEYTEEAWSDFVVDTAKSSISNEKLCQEVDVPNAEWLGLGKWGWVMLTRRHKDKKSVVVKISDTKHANIVTKEWKYGHELGTQNEGIVEYQSVFLYADDDKTMKAKLDAGYESGKLKASVKRTNFPQHYVCMIQEFMNAGSVQDWIDAEILHPTGMIVVLQSVAAALAYMHQQEVTHNDMKPENILLNHEGASCGDKIKVKLGDLGLAEKSTKWTHDITRYGMTCLCMVTGEKYGARKFKAESIQEFVDDLTSCTTGAAEGRLGTALMELPDLMRKVFQETITMKEVRDAAFLQKWEFLDEGSTQKLRSSRGELSRTINGGLAQDSPSDAQDKFSPPVRENEQSGGRAELSFKGEQRPTLAEFLKQ